MALPLASSASELSGHEGREIQVRGTYGVQDLGRHAVKVQRPDGSWEKMHRAAFVKLEDGTFVSVESRPADEMDALAGRLVTVTGTLVVPADSSAEPVAASPVSAPTLVDVTAVDADE
jgi:hypothetical protein